MKKETSTLSKTGDMHIRLKPVLLSRLDTAAAAQGFTRSGLVVAALNAYLERHERPTQTGNAKTGYAAAVDSAAAD